MALKTSFPAPTTVSISSVDSRADLAGLVVRTTAGVPRAGVFPRSNAALVAGRSSMGVDVAAFESCHVRNSLPVLIQNDGTTTVPLLHGAPTSNKRVDLVWSRQRENSSPFADGDNTTVFGITEGAPGPSAVPDWASVPSGALVHASIEIPSTATTTLSGGVVITQLSPYTALADMPIPIRNSGTLSLLSTDAGNVTGFKQGQRVVDLTTGIMWAYFAAFDATTNPSGAKTAGWYPVPGGAEYGGKVVHGSASPTWVAADTLIGGANVWSTTAVGAAKENGIAAFGTGTPTNSGWTCSLDGVYRITAVIHGTSAGGNGQGALILKKNNNTAGGTGGLVAVGDINGGYLTGDITTELELVAGDYVTLSHFNGGSSATMALGAAPEELQFGIQFVRPIRHA